MKNTKRIVLLILSLLVILTIGYALPVHANAPEQVYEIPNDIKGDPIKEYAFNRVASHWGIDQWDSFNKIIIKESRNWSVTREHNPKLSSAYGLGGFLDSTWKPLGCVKTPDPYIQIDCTIKYVKSRYTTPSNALKFHTANNFY